MQAIALRRFRIGERVHYAGDTLTLPAGQYADLTGVGLVGPVPKAVVAKPVVVKRKKIRAKTR